MFGAIKPPWITKKDFIRTPFNFCDRWCERCGLTHSCRVYLQGLKDRDEAIKQGKDPDSMEFAFEITGKHLMVAMAMVAGELEDMGIEIDFEKMEEMPEPTPNPDKLRLKKLVDSFICRVRRLVHALEVVPVDADAGLIKNQLEVLWWFISLVPVKMHRATYNDEGDEFAVEDAKTSAFIGLKGLMAMVEAMMKLARHQPLFTLKPKLKQMVQVGSQLMLAIDEEFDLRVIEDGKV